MLGGSDKTPAVFVDCSTIAVDESVEISKTAEATASADFVCAPVSGNAKVINVGNISLGVIRPKAAYDKVEATIMVVAAEGRILRGRRRARPRLQDRAQRHAFGW